MHLLAATPGTVDDGSEPIDLGQSPADLVVISAADTELAALSQARLQMDASPSVRLASLMHLQHPMSVDLHLDNCATRSRLVIARCLGGAGYWRYGFEQYAARLREAGVPVAFLPGDDKPDPELRTFSTVPDADYDALWSYFTEGGPENALGLLAYAQAMLEDAPRPPTAKPILKAGLYWPGRSTPDFASLRAAWGSATAVVPIVFYRALVQGAGLHPINRLVRALLKEGLAPMPIFVASLKDPVSVATLQTLFEMAAPEVILNCTSFAVGSPHAGETAEQNPLSAQWANEAPILQVVLSASSEEAWETGTSGLPARDIAMNVALPEVDGRILSRAISFKGEAFFDAETECAIATYRARGDRVSFVARLAANLARLRATPLADAKVALLLANYPNKDGRLANGVGLDTPSAVVHILREMAEAGYSIETPPATSDELMEQILAGPTNWLTDRAKKQGGETLPMSVYRAHYGRLPVGLRQDIEARWGPPEQDPFIIFPQVDAPQGASREGGFKLSILRFGNVIVGVQPARGYNIDPEETYHAPDLVPPHNYLAFYFWLRHVEGAQVIAHMGKHGNLEWLPGKALALSEDCWPEAVFGPTPHVYPFIVNDPGEGTQAKRRAQAVIVDHLTPPLTRAETYGPLKDLESLVDEYYEAAGIDRRRVDHLRREILSLSSATGLDQDAGLTGEAERDLAKLDAYLCELKEAQIRDGLHVFGRSPEGAQARDLAIALSRLDRGPAPGDRSLIRALAEDLGLSVDPLECDMAAPQDGPWPEELVDLSSDPWRSQGDTVERLELLAQDVLSGAAAPGIASGAALEQINTKIIPMIADCGSAETTAFLTAVSGRYLAPGPSGAPTRGRLDVLPTGRNFYSVDTRAVPTPTAWALGWKSADLLLETHLQREGDWPRSLMLTAWGTANMRTGGDDIAQALALMGVKPTWDTANRRVTGFEILPLSTLGRPRVDVTLRISGFFRDAFPGLIDLVDSAARAVMARDEADADNPAAACARQDGEAPRVYGSKPGAYGAGLQAMIDERLWAVSDDLGEAYLEWGSYAYGRGLAGARDRAGFESRLSQAEALVQNQDNREHDLLDSDDYYQFEGGAASALRKLQGRDRPIYHNDHSRPERPVIRTLEDEIARVVRSRVVNPKWIDGVKRHGYKGAFEIAATVDYLFAFSATTAMVRGHHFDAVEAAFLEDEATRAFIAQANAPALSEIAERLREAIDRGLWVPRSNSARARIDALLPEGSRHDR
ncbi:MAG: cobaltochelatase subunit CobN [Pseudomonadota bacterium]